MAVASSQRNRTAGMQIRPTRDGNIVIKRSEWVTTLTTKSTSYALLGVSGSEPGFDFNPACTFLFPWISSIALNFERFRFRNLRFRLISSAATTTAGRVYMAVDYDYDDPPAATKLALMNNRSTVEGPVWKDLTLSCSTPELHRDMPEKFVAHPTRSGGVEPRTAYCGYLMVAAETAVGVSWDLEVSYEVELCVPVLDSPDAISTFGDTSPHTTAPADVTAVLPAYGNGYGRIITDLLKISGAPLTPIVPGAGTVPPLTLPLPFSSNAYSGYDLSRAPARGLLTFFADLAWTTYTPLDVLSQLSVGSWTYLYDAAGKYLGVSGPSSEQASQYTSSVAPLAVGGTFVGTAGSIMRASAEVAVSKWLAAFPTLRYIVPMILSTTNQSAAATIGKWKSGYLFMG